MNVVVAGNAHTLMDPPRFSLVAGGAVYRLARALRCGPLGFGMLVALVTWLPLLALSMLQGRAFGSEVTVPFLHNVSVHARLLIAVPLFFLAEAWVDPHLQRFIQYLRGSRLVPPSEAPAFERAVATVGRQRDALVFEVVLLAATIVTVGLRLDLPSDVSSWRVLDSDSAARLSLAGWWYVLVAVPVFQFLLLRWCWRLLIWWMFLWRLSRLDLQLIPTHPDLTGGLGPLIEAQGYFGSLSFAWSAVLAGIFAEQVLFAGTKLQALTLSVVGIVLINLTIFLGPLFLFSSKLLACKWRGLREYGDLAGSYVRGFDGKWLRGSQATPEPLLGTADIQSLADIGSSFEIIRQMRLVPFGRGLVESILIATLAPMLPLLLMAFSLDELIVRLVKLLLHA